MRNMDCLARMFVLALAGTILLPGTASEECSILGGVCSADGVQCCDLGHDCVQGRCEVAGYVPTHGEKCKADCSPACSTRGEACVDGVCRGADGDCAEEGEDCNVLKGCCNPSHDCIPLSDTPLPPLWERAGTCQKTKAADTGAKCDEKTPCRFVFDVCTDGVCRVDPSTLLDVSALTTVKARAPAYDLTDADHGGCGKNLGCGAGRTRDGKVKETSRWSCSEKLDKGPCFIQYTFDSPQDVVSLRLAFHEGDQSARTMRVSSKGEELGSFRSSGKTLDFQTWTLNAEGLTELTLEPVNLPREHWIHLTEVEILTRNRVGCAAR